MMNLFSYVFANRWYRASSKQDFQKLLTPLQLALSTQALCFGGIASLWKIVDYHILFKHRTTSRSSLKTAGCVLGVSIFLGWAITAADTWLHTASSTIQMTTSTATTARGYSRGISANCTAMEKVISESFRPCLLSPGTGGGYIPTNQTEAFATAFNTSSQNRIVMYDHEYALLVPVTTDHRMDFVATTAAIKSTCKLKSRECKLNPLAGTITSFNCSVKPTILGFEGNIQNMTDRYWISYDYTSNPLNSCRIAAAMYTTSVSDELSKDQEISQTIHLQYAAIMVCELFVYDATYTQVNGSITRADFSLTNGTLGRNIFRGFQLSRNFYGVMDYEWMIAATATTAEEMEVRMGNSFAKVMLALIAGIMEPRPTKIQWRRDTRLVARIPTMPLWTLAVLCLAYALFGAVVLGMAIWSVVCGTKEMVDAQMRLSVEAICARALELKEGRRPVKKLEDMFLSKGWEAKRRVVVLSNEVGGMDVDAVPEID